MNWRRGAAVVVAEAVPVAGAEAASVSNGFSALPEGLALNARMPRFFPNDGRNLVGFVGGLSGSLSGRLSVGVGLREFVREDDEEVMEPKGIVQVGVAVVVAEAAIMVVEVTAAVVVGGVVDVVVVVAVFSSLV